MHKLTAFVLVALFSKKCLAQEAFADTLHYQESIQVAINSYHQFLSGGAGLYNGMEHTGYFGKYEGFAYFKTDAWQDATIEYNGVVYEHVSAKYDLVKDQVIVKHPTGLAFGLYSPRVTYFILGGDRFINLPGGSDKTLPETGFYQQLRTGKLTALAKRKKWIEEEIDQLELKKKFVPVNKYFLVKEAVYYSPRKEVSLLALMDKRKTEAKHALRKAKIRFRRAPEQAILTIVDFYNQ